MNLKSQLISILLVLTATICSAAPHLNFSDIESGPKTGLGDGLGDGAIVTIWGNSLGDTQGTSTVSVGGAIASHVYYWGRADGTSGPADLYSRHRMQEVSFSVDSLAADGLGSISVTVGGETSNTLPFTIRSGAIYHVMTTGDNSDDGSYGSPWATNGLTGASSKISAGDIVYSHDGVSEINTAGSGSDLRGFEINGAYGSPGLPISYVAYPGATVIANGENRGINIARPYAVVSKWTVSTGDYPVGKGTGINTYEQARLVGNSVTDREVETGDNSGCADGYAGAISGSNNTGANQTEAVKIYGNYVYEFGCPETTGQHHTTYMTNRSGNSGTAFAVEAWEFGWNYLLNNQARQGIHNYDENLSGNDQDIGDVTGTLKIHDNVIENQDDVGIDVGLGPISGTGTTGWTCDVEIFNNLLINTGGGSYHGSNIQQKAITINGEHLASQVKIYNNTIYGYGLDPGSPNAGAAGAIYFDDGNLTRTVDIKNNIIYDTKDLPYIVSTDSFIPTVSTNNYYSTQNTDAAPVLDSEAVETDPLLDSDYVPSSVLVINSAIDVSPIAESDLYGYVRGTYSIGALEDTGYLPPVSGSGSTFQGSASTFIGTGSFF